MCTKGNHWKKKGSTTSLLEILNPYTVKVYTDSIIYHL